MRIQFGGVSFSSRTAAGSAPPKQQRDITAAGAMLKRGDALVRVHDRRRPGAAIGIDLVGISDPRRFACSAVATNCSRLVASLYQLRMALSRIWVVQVGSRLRRAGRRSRTPWWPGSRCQTWVPASTTATRTGMLGRLGPFSQFCLAVLASQDAALSAILPSTQSHPSCRVLSSEHFLSPTCQQCLCRLRLLHRWLRFPCCGMRFACDLCHEEGTDGHEMKWATRMVRCFTLSCVAPLHAVGMKAF